MTTPNFYVIGAPKCGTETVASWLQMHPDVFVPNRALPNFHAHDFADSIADAGYYASLYLGVQSIAIGEVSPWYLTSQVAVSNILSTNPDARFIVCLRNPIDMAWVLHSAAVADAREHVLDFSVAWAMSHIRRQGRGARYGVDPKTIDYSGLSSVGDQLLRLSGQVESNKIHVVFLDDVLSSPANTWADLQSFLEIDHHDIPNYTIEDFLVERPLPGFHALVRRLADTKGAILPQRFLRWGLADRINGWNRRTGTLIEMPDLMRQRVADYLSDDIGMLSAITDRDLSHWVC
ncbi:hypothetical protein ACOI1H_17670 [Loktanella sp. DJP18]|uniref:hypothetical protein n=1 Tax=Loktanella sp. DJP18 TaxID=3409788 RepID=UPI003BB81121